MNNIAVQDSLNDCLTDLNGALLIITSMGSTANVVPYLNKYAIIRACGTIESAFKTIITDYCNHKSKQQIKNYINIKVRDSSMNPSYDNMISLLKAFDLLWCNNFKNKVNAHPEKDQILLSLKSLVDSRNEFAHGGNPTATADDIYRYYSDSMKLIEIIDSVLT